MSTSSHTPPISNASWPVRSLAVGGRRPSGRNGRRLGIGLAVCLALSACLPIPTVTPEAELPRPLAFFDPAEVEVAYRVIDGFDEPSTPDAFDRVPLLTFSAPSIHRPPAAPRTVVIFSPGILRGAATVDSFARQLVSAAPQVELWSVDRRANLLEDHGGRIAALRSGDPAAAVAYYLGESGNAAPHLPPDPQDLEMLRLWGLDVHLRDLHEVVLAANAAADVVLLAGHSLSGAIISDYAAYLLPDPDGPTGTRRPGQEFVDGLVLIDGGLGRTGGFSLDRGIGLGPIEIEPDVERFLAGSGSPVFDLPGYEPEHQLRETVFGLATYLDPNGVAPDGAAPFPVSNEVAFGLRLSSGYGLLRQFGATMGRATNVETTGNALAFLVSGPAARSSTTLVRPLENRVVGWERGDAPTPIDTFAASFRYPETDPSEWYFPVRLALDVAATDVSLAGREGFVPNATVSVPTLILGAGQGLVATEAQVAAYAAERAGFSVTTVILPGLTHVDITQAEANPAVAVLVRWLTSIERARF